MPGKIELFQGDITTLKVEAIVNAANSTFLSSFLKKTIKHTKLLFKTEIAPFFIDNLLYGNSCLSSASSVSTPTDQT